MTHIYAPNCIRIDIPAFTWDRSGRDVADDVLRDMFNEAQEAYARYLEDEYFDVEVMLNFVIDYTDYDREWKQIIGKALTIISDGNYDALMSVWSKILLTVRGNNGKIIGDFNLYQVNLITADISIMFDFYPVETLVSWDNPPQKADIPIPSFRGDIYIPHLAEYNRDIRNKTIRDIVHILNNCWG